MSRSICFTKTSLNLKAPNNPAAHMNLDLFNDLARTCDSILKSPASGIGTMANPYFHVLSEHPVHLEKYSNLFVENMPHVGDRADDRQARLVRKWAERAVGVARISRKWLHSRLKSKPLSCLQAEALIVSVLVHPDHLDNDDDFYFGKLQQYLKKRQVSSILARINLSGKSSASLNGLSRGRSARQSKRILFPDAESFYSELYTFYVYLKECRKIAKRAKKSTSQFERRLLEKSVSPTMFLTTIRNIRFYNQIHRLCLQTKPKLVITLYEGHAWERLAWRAARSAFPGTLCVGYQHTILRKHAHAAKRTLKPRQSYDPDLILSLGDITHKELNNAIGPAGIRTVTYGTHRHHAQSVERCQPRRSRSFLVLPEGLENENRILIDFALRSAGQLKGYQFTIRFHPVMPYNHFEKEFGARIKMLNNLKVSKNADIETDFNVSTYILYRGSSTVLYAIMAGLKPFYLDIPGVLNIDPIHLLTDWRETVQDADSLAERIAYDQKLDSDERLNQWLAAKSFCQEYIQPVQQKAIDDLLRMAGRANH